MINFFINNNFRKKSSPDGGSQGGGERSDLPLHSCVQALLECRIRTGSNFRVSGNCCKMMKISPLLANQLVTICNPKQLNFRTTEDLAVLTVPAGQERAIAAIDLGIHIQELGYNLYLLGPGGTGKHDLIHSVLNQESQLQPTPDDWCYVYNFDNPQQPIPISLSAGTASIFKKDLENFIQQIQAGGQQSFEVLAVRLIRDLQVKYQSNPAIAQYLAATCQDIVKNGSTVATLDRYQVHILVAHNPDEGAPIVYENNPTLANITGSIEYSLKVAALFPILVLFDPAPCIGPMAAI